MKKFIFFTLSLLSVLIIAGCSNSDGTSGKGDKNIEVLNDKGLKKDWNKTVTPIIEKDTGLKVDVIDTIDVTAYTTNIKQSLSSKNAPSLFTWWTGTQLDDLASNDLLAEISEDEWQKLVGLGISNDLKESLSSNGKIYGAPLYTVYNGVFYNKNIYDKLGLKEPGSLEEFIDNCQKIKDSGVTPIGIGSTWASFVWPMALVGSFNPDLYDEWTNGNVGFDDPRIKEVFYFWADMLKKGYFTEQQQDQGKDMGMGETAMVMNINAWSAGLVEDYGVKLGKDIDVFYMPNKGGQGKKTIFYEIAPFLIAKNGSKESALKTLESYYSKDAQEVYAKKTGASAITDIKVDNPITNKMMQGANNSDEYILKLRYYEHFTPEVVNLSIDEYWKIVGNPNKKQVDESLATIQKAWEDAQAKK